jgi:hypothetical protein
VSLAEELQRVADLAVRHANEGDIVSGVIPTEDEAGRRVYLCSIDGADGYRGWLAVRDDGTPVADRLDLRAAIAIAALCEVAEDAAGGGALDDLIARLEELRRTDAPPGIEDAEEAARALRAAIGEPPQVASAERLDEIGAATRRLELELDPSGASPFASAMRASQGAVGELQREIEAGYLLPLT